MADIYFSSSQNAHSQFNYTSSQLKSMTVSKGTHHICWRGYTLPQ